MAKHVIAIISVLKPIDDTRNFEKIARTLSNTSKYEINIIGFSSKKNRAHTNILFHPVFSFGRLSYKRLLAPYKIFTILLKVKPELIIVTCAELLIVTVLYKIIFGAKIIYDVQENYFRNIAYSQAYFSVLRYPLAYCIRATELFSSVFIDHFFLAEKVYAKQLPFAMSNAIVVENKSLNFKKSDFVKKTKEECILLYSGTIAEHYGIFDAIRFVERLQQRQKTLRLVIAGFAAQKTVHKRLFNATQGKNYIEFMAESTPLPHDKIISEMIRADFCILPYHSSKCIEGRIPTKLYECLALEKPVIISPNPAWNDMIMANNAGILYDFSQNKEFPIYKLRKKYYGNNLSAKYGWDNESEKVIRTVRQLIE